MHHPKNVQKPIYFCAHICNFPKFLKSVLLPKSKVFTMISYSQAGRVGRVCGNVRTLSQFDYLAFEGGQATVPGEHKIWSEC